MSAVFEISVMSKKNIQRDILFEAFKRKGLSLEIDLIEVIDNWKYENEVILDNNISTTVLDDYVINGKIIMLDGLIDTKYRCGYHSELKRNNTYLTDFWVSLEYLPDLDVDNITLENVIFYETVTDEIIKLRDKYEIELCGMGVELFMEYSQSIGSTILKSKNVNRWIVPKERQVGVNPGSFFVCEKKGFVILSNLKRKNSF